MEKLDRRRGFVLKLVVQQGRVVLSHLCPYLVQTCGEFSPTAELKAVQVVLILVLFTVTVTIRLVYSCHAHLFALGGLRLEVFQVSFRPPYGRSSAIRVK